MSVQTAAEDDPVAPRTYDWDPFKRLLGYEIAFTGFTTLVILISGLGGLVLFAVALVGEYVARIYDEVKQRPGYIVRQTSEDE